MADFVCETCRDEPGKRKYSFSDAYTLKRHLKSFHKPGGYDCNSCDEKFKNRYDLQAHMKAAHPHSMNPPAGTQKRNSGNLLRENSSFSLDGMFEDRPSSVACPFCPDRFGTPQRLRDHWRRDHPQETGHADLSTKTLDEREKFIEDNLRSRPDLFILPLVHEASKQNAKFKLSQNTYRFALNEAGLEAVKLAYGSELIAGVFTYVVNEIKKQCKPKERSYIAFHITADCLDTPLSVPYTLANDFSPDQIIEAIYALGTSDKYIEADDNLSIRMDMLNLEPPDHMSFGAVTPRVMRSLSALENFSRKKWVYGFSNVIAEFDCALVAFALSQLKREIGPKFAADLSFRKTSSLEVFAPGYRPIKSGSPIPAKLEGRVARLFKRFEERFNFFQPQGREFIVALQEYMETLKPPQQLLVYKEDSYEEPFFAGSILRAVEDRVYFLYLDSEHICFLANPPSFFTAHLWDCCTAVTVSKTSHTCKEQGRWCVKCGTRTCWESEQAAKELVCSKCLTFFDRIQCFTNHEQGSPSHCSTHATCKRCLGVQKRMRLCAEELEPHDCLSYKCRYCHEKFDAVGTQPHFCVYQVPNDDDKVLGGGDKEFYRIYFDMETCVRGDDNHLVPYLTCAVFVCSKCQNDLMEPALWAESYPCCGKRKRTYWFKEGMQSFLRDTFRGRKDLKRGIAVAYNMRNFDGYFLLDALLDAGAKLGKNVCIAGNRLMSISFNGVQVKDLNCFVHGSLASLPRSFGLADLVRKGHFPHGLANTLSFAKMKVYETPGHPPLEMYSPWRSKSKEALAELREWHASVAEKPFNFSHEAAEYCLNDAVVMALCAEKLDEAIREFSQGHVSLLNSSVFTLASLTMTIFKKCFMKVDIGIVPQSGYTPGRHSQIADSYFRYLNKERALAGRPAIQWALNTGGGEFRCDRRRVDGYCPEENKLYEFMGCYWHACKECYGNAKAVHPTYKVPYYAVRARDVRRIKQLENAFTAKVHVIKECVVRRLLEEKMSGFHNFHQQYLSLVETDEALTVRGAVHGGRTEVFAPYKRLSAKEIDRGVRIVHIDVHSLYPSVQAGCDFPSKPHPSPIDGSELHCHGYNWGLSDVRRYFGIFSVCLLYTRSPFYPPVPFKCRGKSVYGTCKACMVSNLQGFCRHTKLSERAFKVTLTSVDLELALENGAVLLRIFAIWDYGKKNVSKEMYRSMMMPLVRGKLLAKGRAGRSDEQLLAMANEWAKVGVHFQPEDFGPNKPALYLVYKLLMVPWFFIASCRKSVENSLWGKQAMKNRSTAKQLVTDPAQAAKLIWDPLTRLTSVSSMASGKSLLVETETVGEDQLEAHGSHNPLVAAFVTAYGRRALFQGLQQCGTRALYCDTDSIIYISDPKHRHTEPYIDPHGLLGSWVDENKKGTFIKVAVFTAPKVMHYLTYLEAAPNGEPCGYKSRMKGVGVNSTLQEVITPELLHSMAVRQVQELGPLYQEILDRLAASTSEAHVASARAKTKTTGQLHFPQSNLVKQARELSIRDKSATSTKMVRFHFDKRVLESQFISLDYIPSFPFGMRESEVDAL